MKYALLIYETPEDFASRSPSGTEPYTAAWRIYHRALVAAGAHAEGGAPLKEAGTATTMRVKDGQRHVQDGPFADSKEQLGGFVILDVDSLDEALEWAARCPAAATGAVEVRPIEVIMHEAITRP